LQIEVGDWIEFVARLTLDLYVGKGAFVVYRFTIGLQNEIALLHCQIDGRQSVLIVADPVIAHNIIDRFALENPSKRGLYTLVREKIRGRPTFGRIQIVRRQSLVLGAEHLLVELTCEKVVCRLHHTIAILRLL